MTMLSDDIAAWRQPARPVPPSLLEAAIACRRSGISPSDGAPLLADRYDPDVHSLASIVAGVWNVGDRPETIGLALHACARWGEDEIAAAVGAVAGRGGGMLVRNSPADTGAFPAGEAGDSPDIISAGAGPADDPAFRFGLDWGGRSHQAVPPGAVDHVYVRARNLFPGPESARVTLLAVPAPLLMRLSGAEVLRTPSGRDSVELRASRADEIVVGDEPFLWRTPADGAAMSLVARIETPHAPAAGPREESAAGIASWLMHHPGFAWRSVGLLDGRPARERIIKLRIGNPGPGVGRFLLVVVCTGLPDGLKIGLRARFAGIDAGASQAGTTPMMLAPLVILAGWHEEDLTVEPTDPDGTRLTTGGTIDLRYYAVAGAEEADGPAFLDPASLGISAAGLAVDDRLGLLGSYRLAFQALGAPTIGFDPSAARFNMPDRSGEPADAAALTRVPG